MHIILDLELSLFAVTLRDGWSWYSYFKFYRFYNYLRLKPIYWISYEHFYGVL